jgi:hypothetical protein
LDEKLLFINAVFLLINPILVITEHSSCSAYHFLVWVTVESKTCEQEDGEISWSPSPYRKMAGCLVMLALHWVRHTGRLKFACFINFFFFWARP